MESQIEAAKQARGAFEPGPENEWEGLKSESESRGRRRKAEEERAQEKPAEDEEKGGEESEPLELEERFAHEAQE